MVKKKKSPVDEMDLSKVSLSDIPAGYKRDEEIAKRKVAAQKKGEKMTENLGRIPEKHLKPEREIQYRLRRNFLDLNIPGMRVKWVNYSCQNGYAVWAAMEEGWQVVKKEQVMDDKKFLAAEDNTFKVGDVMAMCIPEDHYAWLQAEMGRRADRALGEEHTAELRDIAAKHPGNFIVHDNMDEASPLMQRLGASADSSPRRAAAQRMATEHIGNKMKEGLVDGIPLK